MVEADEQPFKADPAKIPTLKPAFREGGTVTAANSSSISDGGAALGADAPLGGRAPRLRRPKAVVRGHAGHAQAPAWFTTAPIAAVRANCSTRSAGRPTRSTSIEINEAFACVAMAAMRDLDLPHDKVNVNGGACALGHPIGCSGARLLVTLAGGPRGAGLSARGVASLCIGGGEATAMALERVG